STWTTGRSSSSASRSRREARRSRGALRRSPGSIDHDPDDYAPDLPVPQEEVRHVGAGEELPEVAVAGARPPFAPHAFPARPHLRSRRPDSDAARRALLRQGRVDLRDRGIALEVHRVAAVEKGRVRAEVVAPVPDARRLTERRPHLRLAHPDRNAADGALRN